jgi:hypothetical protein
MYRDNDTRIVTPTSISLQANVEFSEWRKIHDVNQAFSENGSLSHYSVNCSIK